MKLVKISNLIFLVDDGYVIEDYKEIVEIRALPEKPPKIEENIIHGLYLEDFLDNDNY